MDTLCEAFQSLRLKDSAIFNWETEQLTCTKTKFDKNFISQYEQKEISFIKELLPETFYSVWVIRPKGEIIDQGDYYFLRVVQTQAILFLKTLSERVGSDIYFGTTLNLNDVIFNRFEVDQEIHHSISASLYVGSDSFRQCFQK